MPSLQYVIKQIVHFYTMPHNLLILDHQFLTLSSMPIKRFLFRSYLFGQNQLWSLFHNILNKSSVAKIILIRNKPYLCG